MKMTKLLKRQDQALDAAKLQLALRLHIQFVIYLLAVIRGVWPVLLDRDTLIGSSGAMTIETEVELKVPIH